MRWPSKDPGDYGPAGRRPGSEQSEAFLDLDEGRGERARRLLGLSWRLVREDRRLWAYPALSAFSSLLLGGGSFLLSLQVTGSGHFRRTALLAGIVVSYPATFVSLFCGVALAAALRARLEGGTVTAGCGWAAARQRVGIIAGWTLLTCTVGACLRVLEEYVPLGGKIVAFVLDVTWSVATLFVVPVIAYERLGPRATLKRSTSIFRDRWGEQVIGGVSIGVGAWLLTMPCVALIIGGVSGTGTAAAVCLVLGGGGILAIGAGTTALEQVFRVFVYRHALGIDDGQSSPFRPNDLSRPLVSKGRR